MAEQKPVEEMSIEELEAFLDAGDYPEPGREPESAPAVPKPEPEPESPAAEAAPSEPEPEPEPEPEAEPDIETERAALAAERLQIEKDKMAADLEYQRAHGSRLAGEIGHLRKQLETLSRQPSEPYKPETDGEIDRLAQLERRQQELENEARQAKVDQAWMESVSALESETVVEFKEELQALLPKYTDLFRDTKALTDPDLARQMTSAVVRSYVADAKELRWQNRHKVLEERAAASSAQITKSKKASAISASGASPTPQPKPKSFADMTAKEADEWLRENVR